MTDESLLFKLLGGSVLLALLLIGALALLERPIPEALNSAAAGGIGALAMAARYHSGEKANEDSGDGPKA